MGRTRNPPINKALSKKLPNPPPPVNSPTSRKKRTLNSTLTTATTISKSKVTPKDNFKNRQSQAVITIQSKNKGRAKAKVTTVLIKDNIISQTNGHIDNQHPRGKLRTSSRSRPQSIPYQSPESVLKISAVFPKTPTKQSSSNSKSKSKSTIESLNTTIKKSRTTTTQISSPSKNDAKKLQPRSRAKKDTSKTKSKTTIQSQSPTKKLNSKISKSKIIVNSIKQKAKKTAVAAAKKAGKASKTANAAAGVQTTSPRRKRKLKQDEDEGDDESEGTDADRDPFQDQKVKKKRVSKKSKKSDSEDSKKTKEPKAKPLKKSKKRGAALDPKPHLPMYDKDPTFYSKTPIPSISTLVDSRLLFRAIHLHDNALLESILKKKKAICTLAPFRSVHNKRTPMSYAVETGNVEAIKILVDTKSRADLGSSPEILLKERSSDGRGGGYRNKMMFGHALRDVTVGRGGKEGNHAFTYDESDYTSSNFTNLYEIIDEALEHGLSYETLEKLNQIPEGFDYNKIPTFLINCIASVTTAIRSGHREVAGRLIQDAIRRQGHGFNDLHLETLVKNSGEALSPFKSVSVVKKSIGTARITPLHCAAINPNSNFLQELLNSNPEIMVLDGDNWTLLHYAAVCKGTGPLKYLLQRGGIATNALTKQGLTPLVLAIQKGRVDNAKLIIETELEVVAAKEQEAEEESKNKDSEEKEDENNILRPIKPMTKTQKANLALSKFSGLSLVFGNKNGMTPMHWAAACGQVEILQILLQIPAVDVNRNTPAQYDKLTPFILACQKGHLNVVQYLVEERETLGVKFELGDRRGRTGLAHAVMNGHTHIVSYLLRIGVNHLTKDTSGNTLVHYAAAYGWYFILKLLLEAGCSAAEGNQWKMTPLAIAFMKGHIGIVQFLMDHPGMNINSPVNDNTGKQYKDKKLWLKGCNSQFGVLMEIFTFSCCLTLLHEACNSKPSKNFYDRLIFLLDDMGADCTITDFKKNNCLHMLVKNENSYIKGGYSSFRNERGSYITYTGSENQKYLFKAVKLLMERGCSPTSPNDDQVTPITTAFQSTPCFDLLGEIFEIHPTIIPSFPDRDGNNFLHSIAPYVSCASSDTFLKKLVKNPENLLRLKLFAKQANAKGFTPLLRFINDFTSATVPSGEVFPRVQYFLSLLVHKLDSDLTAIVQDKSKNSVLHLAAQSPSSFFLKELLFHNQVKSNLEILNTNKATPLVSAILYKRLEAVHTLIEAGANVNVDVSTNTKDSSKPISLLIHVCETPVDGTFNLVPLLIRKGARLNSIDHKHGNSILHFIASCPNYKGAVESIQMILERGFQGDCVNKLGRTPLHLVVNARGGETDVSYDIEDILIEKAPASLAVKDTYGRVPLHYAFVKIGKFQNASFMDPIELVGILVQGMKDNGLREEIKCIDEFGSMPLHYAAVRGATISSSFLVNETSPRLIDIDDSRGNTPFGLAVLNSHEGCALAFQQLNGNFTLSLNTEIPTKKKRKNSEDNATSAKPKWDWNILEDRYKEDEKVRVAKCQSTVLEQVVSKDWQGILHLMLETLKNTGASARPGIHSAIKTLRLKLALKLMGRIKNGGEEIKNDDRGEGTLLHILAKYCHKAPHSNAVDEGNKIFASLISKGVDIFALDRFKSTALIHAAKVRDLYMCRLIWNEMHAKAGNSSSSRRLMVAQDVFGRNNISALFWELSQGDLSLDLKAWALEQSGDFNTRCRYPVRLTKYPGVKYFSLGLGEDVDENGEGEEKGQHLLTPLILCVVYGNYSVVKWLLGLKGKIDVNYPDGLGRTAIMHAVRLNDIMMVKLLLNPKGYKPEDDNVPWDAKSFYTPKSNHGVDLTIKDNKGLGVLDYVISPVAPQFCYVNATQILKILHKANKAILTQDALQMSLRENKQHLAQIIQELQGVSLSKQVRVTQEYPKLIAITDEIPSLANTNKPDFMKDAQSMATILIAEAELKEIELEKEKNKHKIPSEDENQIQGLSSNNSIPKSRFVLIPDPLIGSDASLYEVAMENDQPFDIILTKVDLNYGMFGLYNFYKMQLLIQPKGKGMILLFTRWGRFGDEGQYQKTPFGSYEEAVKEFKKIFKSKSGNNWDDINGPTGFIPIPKRYRLVHKELRNRKVATDIKVDFSAIHEFGEKRPSTISKPTGDLIQHLSLLHRYPYSTLQGISADYTSPFGRLTVDSLAKGDEILKKIEQVLKEKTILNQKHDHSQDEEQKLMEELVNLSEEYYTLVPVFGFNTEKLTPIFTSDDLRAKQEVIYNFLHLEFATQLLLGAHFNCTSTSNNPSTSTTSTSLTALAASIPRNPAIHSNSNPFDYIYSCLGARIQVLSPQEEEAQLILQYKTNTHEETYNQQRITNIYRIERPEDENKLKNFEQNAGVQNRWLLWHGTKDVNLLSIISKGLQVAPIGAQLSGHLFGKGIYLADMFEKSLKYCHGAAGVMYMFLCEASLGKVHPVTINDTSDDSTKGLPNGCHSVVTADSQYEPDPGTTISWNGRTVPLGKRTTKVLKKDQYYGLSYNEYIVFNPDQVRLKYLVQFQAGKATY